MGAILMAESNLPKLMEQNKENKIATPDSSVEDQKLCLPNDKYEIVPENPKQNQTEIVEKCVQKNPTPRRKDLQNLVEDLKDYKATQELKEAKDIESDSQTSSEMEHMIVADGNET